MSDNLVSIVVPAYNVGNYLLQCLNSINDQTYDNFEVIIIDDGSTDNTLEIATEYCKDNEKFAVFTQPNSGSGPARNNGLSKSKGKFVMFVDPDDWLESDLLNNLVVSQAEGDYDLVATRRNIIYCNLDGSVISRVENHYKPEVLVGVDSIRDNLFRLLTLKVSKSPTQKLYKRSIIAENNVEFPDLRRSQDIVFNLRYINCISSVSLISYSGYNYRVFKQNGSGRFVPDHYNSIVYIYNCLRDLYKNWQIDFPAAIYSSFVFDLMLFPFLLTCVDKKWDRSFVYDNDVIFDIVANAKGLPLFKKIAKWLIEKRSNKLLFFYLKVILFFKQFKNTR